MRLAGMMAFGFFRRFGHRAGGDHQKRERNTERSAHVHPAESPSWWHPLVGEARSRGHSNGIGWAGGKQIGVVPDCCRRIRVGQGGTAQAKQGKMAMSTPTAFYPWRAVSRLSWAERDDPQCVARPPTEYYYRLLVLL